jgi:hypothetical protein
VEQEYAEAMKKLARQFYDHEIVKSVYREKRKLLVDHMDNEFNGASLPEERSEKITATAPINPIE